VCLFYVGSCFAVLNYRVILQDQIFGGKEDLFQKILHVNIIIIVTITYKRFFKYKEDITLFTLAVFNICS
jgi:hypothetical protein